MVGGRVIGWALRGIGRAVGPRIGSLWDDLDIIKYFREAGPASRTVAPAAKDLAQDQAELAAQRVLTDVQGGIQGGHFLSNHSPLVSPQELINRATQGVMPATGEVAYATTASRFYRYSDMLEVMTRATNHWDQGLVKAAYRGGRLIGYETTVPMLQEIGEGYTKTAANRFTSSTATVYFNLFGEVVSMFPANL